MRASPRRPRDRRRPTPAAPRRGGERHDAERPRVRLQPPGKVVDGEPALRVRHQDGGVARGRQGGGGLQLAGAGALPDEGGREAAIAAEHLHVRRGRVEHHHVARALRHPRGHTNAISPRPVACTVTTDRPARRAAAPESRTHAPVPTSRSAAATRRKVSSTPRTRSRCCRPPPAVAQHQQRLLGVAEAAVRPPARLQAAAAIVGREHARERRKGNQTEKERK